LIYGWRLSELYRILESFSLGRPRRVVATPRLKVRTLIVIWFVPVANDKSWAEYSIPDGSDEAAVSLRAVNDASAVWSMSSMESMSVDVAESGMPMSINQANDGSASWIDISKDADLRRGGLSTRGEDGKERIVPSLPDGIWKQIIQLVADPNEVLSAAQFQFAVEYGTDVATLGGEKELEKKGESHQIWRLLEATSCLSYIVPRARLDISTTES
jgi:hypothetical protein